MDKLRILHISDLHLAENQGDVGVIQALGSPLLTFGNIKDGNGQFNRTSSYSLEVLEALTNLIDELPPLDGLIVSGDIATSGAAGDLRKALSYFDGPGDDDDGSVKSFPSVAGAADPMMLIPGNHDRYHENGMGFKPGGWRFDDIFGANWQEDKVKTWLHPADTFELAVVGADLTLRSIDDAEENHIYKKEACAYGQGKVHPDVLERLVKETKAYRTAIIARGKIPVIFWVVHFPPCFPPSDNLFSYILQFDHLHKLIGDLELVAAANDCVVSAITCGHIHKRHSYQPDKMKGMVYCAGTATQFQSREGHFCQLFEIAPGEDGIPEITPVFFEYEEDEGRFMSRLPDDIKSGGK